MNREQALSTSPAAFHSYIQQVPDGDILRILDHQLAGFHAFFLGLSDEQWAFRYAEGKWSVKQVVGHMIDSERVFSYRALVFGRNDATDLPGFEEDDYVAEASSDARAPMDLMEEFDLVRRSTIVMLRGMPEGALARLGTANGLLVSVGALAWSMAGHVEHHVKVVGERYLGN